MTVAFIPKVNERWRTDRKKEAYCNVVFPIRVNPVKEIPKIVVRKTPAARALFLFPVTASAKDFKNKIFKIKLTFINYHAVEECIADTTKLKNREISHHCRCDFFSFGLRAVFVDLNEFFCPALDTSKIKIHSRDLNDEEQCCWNK